MKVSTILILLLGIMCFYDFSLHLVQLLNVVQYHPLYPIFSSAKSYDIFWMLYWEVGAVLALLIWRSKDAKS